MRLTPAVLLPVALVSTMLLAACGDGDETVKPSPTISIVQDTAPAPTPELQRQPDVSQQLDATASLPEAAMIAIEARDVLFASNRWTVSVGETITIRVANADSQDHNLRIAGLDGAYETEDDALTAPSPVGAGQSGELTFAPLVPGDYTFRCDFHPASMGGQIEVEAGVP